MAKSLLALAAAAAFVLAGACDAPTKRKLGANENKAAFVDAAKVARTELEANKKLEEKPFVLVGGGDAPSSSGDKNEADSKPYYDGDKNEADSKPYYGGDNMMEADSKPYYGGDNMMEAGSKPYYGGDNMIKTDNKAYYTVTTDRAADKRAADRASLDTDMKKLTVELQKDNQELGRLCMVFSKILPLKHYPNRLVRALQLSKVSRDRFDKAVEGIKVSGDDGGAMEKLAQESLPQAPWGKLVRSARQKALLYYGLRKEYDDLAES